jgi:hypothetical protein
MAPSATATHRPKHEEEEDVVGEDEVEETGEGVEDDEDEADEADEADEDAEDADEVEEEGEEDEADEAGEGGEDSEEEDSKNAKAGSKGGLQGLTATTPAKGATADKEASDAAATTEKLPTVKPTALGAEYGGALFPGTAADFAKFKPVADGWKPNLPPMDSKGNFEEFKGAK